MFLKLKFLHNNYETVVHPEQIDFPTFEHFAYFMVQLVERKSDILKLIVVIRTGISNSMLFYCASPLPFYLSNFVRL